MLRVTREWRNLKLRKWAGWGHGSSVNDSVPRVALFSPEGPGSLATFCSTCPQPNVNLPDNWREDPNQYGMFFKVSHLTEMTSREVYTRSFVNDGNFTAIHQEQSNAGEDAPLTNGELFMTERVRYQAHLSLAKETKQASVAIVLVLAKIIVNSDEDFHLQRTPGHQSAISDSKRKRCYRYWSDCMC